MSMTHSVCSPSCSGRYAEPLPPHHRQLWRSPTLGRTFTRRHGRHGGKTGWKITFHFTSKPDMRLIATSSPRLLAATTRSPIVITAAASPRRELSWQQRWRAFKFNMKEKKAQLGNVPPFAQILAAAAAVRAALQPLYDVAAALQLRWEQFNETYNQFLAEETKEKWTWAKRNRKEMAFLDAIPPYVFGKLPMRWPYLLLCLHPSKLDP